MANDFGLNLRTAPEYRLLKVNQVLASWMRNGLLALFGVLGGLLTVFGLLFNQHVGLGLGIIFLGLALGIIWLELFWRLGGSTIAKKSDLARFLDREALIALTGLKALTLGELSRVILLTPTLARFFEFLDLNAEDLALIINAPADESFNINDILTKAGGLASERGDDFIRPADIWRVLVESAEPWQKALGSHTMTVEDALVVYRWWRVRFKEVRRQKRFWDPASFRRYRPLGVSWAAGYTPELDQFARPIDRAASADFRHHAIVHRPALEQVEAALERDSINNVLLIGDVGVGKRALIHEFARRIYEGRTVGVLNFKRVLELDLEGLLSASSDPAAVRARLIAIFNEAVGAGNVILVLANLDTFIGQKSVIGSSDLSEILAPYLESPRFQMIATTTQSGFQRAIEPSARLNNLFIKVAIEEPAPQETLAILADLAWPAGPTYRQSGPAPITLRALKEVVILTDQYYMAKRRPQKAVQLLEDLLGNLGALATTGPLNAAQVQQFVSTSLGFSVGLSGTKERERLINLETELHRRVIGQDHAITLIADALRRVRAGVHGSKRPAGSFLFIGPTGVGKTEVSKALAEAYFGQEEAMIRFDMSEFQGRGSVLELIGASSSDKGGRLTEAVKAKPMSLILLDEIEKADPDVLNIFLQVLDEGMVRDGLGDTIWFTNCLIIATSNAGSEFIRENVQKMSMADLGPAVLDVIQRQGIFRPEFLNRFDAVVPFHPLSREQIESVARLLLKGFATHMKKTANIDVIFGPNVVNYLADHGFQPEFGARPMRRALQDSVESYVAKQILAGAVTSGGQLNVAAENLG